MITLNKTMMENFLDEFLNDHDFEETFEYLDLDIYEVLELAFEDGLVNEEILERLL